MEFTISGVTVNPFMLAGIGFLVGILGGFFGVGGGFIAAPFMLWSGVPTNFVVGTDLAHMTGKSMVALRHHRALGHVDAKLGGIMVIGTIFGVEGGAQMIERLKHAGNLDLVIGVAYVIILLIVSAFTAYESIRALRMIQTDSIDAKDAIGFKGVARRVQNLRLPPYVSLPASGIEKISIWSLILVGFLTGSLAGMLGVGGGFIRMPLLIYVLGIPTHVAVGTDLFEIIFSAGFGTITHAIKGNVDILMALVMGTGAAIGAQIGATSTRFFVGPRIRLMFSVLPLIGAIMVILNLFNDGIIHF
ncbi:MAG: sulfite exporter TauE/SafE family protein [Chloroflexota bacterium]